MRVLCIARINKYKQSFEPHTAMSAGKKHKKKNKK